MGGILELAGIIFLWWMVCVIGGFGLMMIGSLLYTWICRKDEPEYRYYIYIKEYDEFVEIEPRGKLCR